MRLTKEEKYEIYLEKAQQAGEERYIKILTGLLNDERIRDAAELALWVKLKTNRNLEQEEYIG